MKSKLDKKLREAFKKALMEFELDKKDTDQIINILKKIDNFNGYMTASRIAIDKEQDAVSVHIGYFTKRRENI